METNAVDEPFLSQSNLMASMNFKKIDKHEDKRDYRQYVSHGLWRQ